MVNHSHMHHRALSRVVRVRFGCFYRPSSAMSRVLTRVQHSAVEVLPIASNPPSFASSGNFLRAALSASGPWCHDHQLFAGSLAVRYTNSSRRLSRPFCVATTVTGAEGGRRSLWIMPRVTGADIVNRT